MLNSTYQCFKKRQKIPLEKIMNFRAQIVENFQYCTVFENHRKSLIQHCERSELRLHFEWTKVKLKNAKNGPIWRVFENLKLAVK